VNALELQSSMRYSLLAGGKRLRPILCLVFADTLSQQGANLSTAEDAACALEYVHTYSLIHDDLPSMDDDDLRRGRPTCHKVFGEAMAILAGDALFSEAFVLMASGLEPVRTVLCRELAVASGATGMVGGQVLDIAEDRPAQLDYLKRLHRLKTGAVIRAACRMGFESARRVRRQSGPVACRSLQPGPSAAGAQPVRGYPPPPASAGIWPPACRRPVRADRPARKDDHRFAPGSRETRWTPG
jgi:geranylgeranyl pyrophosphate synthase